jgi:hypothetical protein
VRTLCGGLTPAAVWRVTVEDGLGPWEGLTGGGFRAGGPIGCVPRKPRIEIAGGFHHVWARGNRRQAIYADDADRLAYLAKTGAVVR